MGRCGGMGALGSLWVFFTLIAPGVLEAKCDPPGQFPNGQIKEPIGLQVGKIVHFSCNEGYRLIGSSTAMCIISDNGLIWDNEAPICDRIPCEAPQAITNGEFVAPTEDFYYGMVVTYRCKTGDRGEKLFNLVGEPSLHCTSSDGEVGVWSGPPPQCIELGKCTPPHVENAVMVSESRSLFSLRDTVEFRCQPGFIMEGISSVQCQDLNKWEPELPSCFQVKSCGPFLEQLPNGNVLFPLNLQIGAKVSFVCNKGFQLKGNSASYCILAGRDSIWNSSVPVCERIPCEAPQAITNGEFVAPTEDFYYGMVVTYRCKTGDRGEKLFNLVSKPSLHCTSSDGEVGVWSGPPPQCIELGKCTPPHVENAVMVSESRSLFSLRDTVEFRCQPGFIMEGISSVQCQDLNKWEPELPSCFQVKSCGPFLEQLPNGNVLFPLNLQIGAKVSFICNKGFQLKGNSASYCILAGRDSIWNSSVPVCERVTCIIPEHMSGIYEELK
ncbi:complement component receptor 1-like protein isoform X2 [Microtus oregoni]|uniref:complement component receptor 1-like protein isoform X2 n=1 Tax=Microtus oregoni TaxID=111838 RepID=UPI001BB2C37B|nr:complement component receptor 1-like protein isoform X2 [Microtus oregoni]